MRISEAVTLEELRRQERSSKANVTLGSYGVELHAPAEEFRTFRGTLETDDGDQLFLLNCGFIAGTRGETGRVTDIVREELSDSVAERVRSLMEPRPELDGRSIDLRSSSALAPVLVCTDAIDGPWTIIDGNHRAIAQFLLCGDMDDVPVYVCVHPRIGAWSFVPGGARSSA